MPRNPPTAEARSLHRLQIATGDLDEAANFILAAIRAEKNGATWRDVTHRALLCSAVIYYARPFSPNEHPNPRKRPTGAADTRIDLEPLRLAIPDPVRRKLHRKIIRERNKIVAHAESSYFPVKRMRVILAPRRGPERGVTGFGYSAGRLYPSYDLNAMLRNVRELRNVCVAQSQMLADNVWRQKRLRRAPIQQTVP